MYNDSSCVACHNLGAPGGGGPGNKNVDILTADRPLEDDRASDPGSGPAGPPRSHPGFREATSLVLHRFGTDPAYEAARLTWLGARAPGNSPARPGAPPDGQEALELEQVRRSVPGRSAGDDLPTRARRGSTGGATRSQRNPTALFGAGLIDAIPGAAIEATAKVARSRHPEIKGRVCRLEDGRIGRFGWKAQLASLEDFVLTACAVELGLEVPGQAQGGDPLAPGAKAPGLDLDAAGCRALVAFVRDLPAPGRQSSGDVEALRAGEEFFHTVGCAECHIPKLGEVEGIYSDLLLHDLGPDIGDTGSYSTFRPSQGEATAGRPREASRGSSGASRQEWRTPPLWGVRDSGPYLHDGRAETLEQAIALHGGEGRPTALRFFALSPGGRAAVVAFLKSMIAPTAPGDRPGPTGL
jgi:mono/diheme cytochrome c family protein